MKLLNRLQSGRWKSLVQARAKITSNQRLNSCSFEPPGEVDHRLRQLLCQEKLAAALDVMPAAALNRPTAAGENPGHLIAAQVSSRRSAVAEAMPDKSEAVRVYVEHVEATGQNRAQLGRRREKHRSTLSLRTGQDEQKRCYRGILNGDRLPPTCLSFRQKHGDAAADRVDLPSRVMNVCRRDPRYFTDTQPAIVRDQHSHTNRDFAR